MLYGYAPGTASRLHGIIIIVITQKIQESQDAAHIFCNKNTEAWDNNILTIIVMQRYIFKNILCTQVENRNKQKNIKLTEQQQN